MGTTSDPDTIRLEDAATTRAEPDPRTASAGEDVVVQVGPPPEAGPDPGPESGSAPATPEQPPERASSSTGGVAVVAFYAAIAIIWAWNTDGGRAFLVTRWIPLVVLATAAGVAVATPRARRRMMAMAPDSRVGVVVFVLIPMVLLLVGTVVLLPARYQVTVLRAVFLLAVCLLPAMMWYLFITTRKASLLNEFLTNLDRLGLLDPREEADSGPPESAAAHQRRLYTYLQKFAAVYGPVPDAVCADVLAGEFDPASAAEANAPQVLTSTTAPVIGSTVLIGLGWLLILPPVVGTAGAEIGSTPVAERWLLALDPVAAPVAFAFLGAYFFSLQMLFRRYLRRDLRGSAYVSVSLRIVLAVFGTWVVAAALEQAQAPSTPAQLLVIGFGIGVFPRIIWQFVQGAFRRVGVAIPGLRTESPISDLDGLTVWHEARLEEEDIENVPNMATADLVDLLLNTRLPPDRIVDWVDQAILYTYLGPRARGRRDELRAHGIRTATALSRAVAPPGAADPGPRAQLAAALPATDELRLTCLEATIATNPNLALVRRWRGVP